MNTDLIIHLRPPRIAMTAVLVATLLHGLHPVLLHSPFPAAGTAIGLAGFALMLRAWWLFRVSGTAICPTRRSTTLITGDVYALTRNPMYLGIAAMIGAPGLATGSLVFYAASLVFVTIIDRFFCPHEEQKATSEFGERYLDYRASVRRWL